MLLLGIVLHLRAFRRYVDERLDQIERAKAAEQRSTLLLQMSDEHRRELLRLESIVDRIRDATRPHGTAAQIAVDECLRLLASYVRLAIAYNVSRECLASVDRKTLEDEMRTARGGALLASSAHTRALAHRRLVIARKRADRWDRSREALEAIAHQLAMIGELVQLTHEQVAAPADPGGATDEIDRVVEAARRQPGDARRAGRVPRRRRGDRAARARHGARRARLSDVAWPSPGERRSLELR